MAATRKRRLHAITMQIPLNTVRKVGLIVNPFAASRRLGHKNVLFALCVCVTETTVAGREGKWPDRQEGCVLKYVRL